MEKAHMLSIANYRDVSTEREARAVFREFRPKLFETTVIQLFESPPELKEAIDFSRKIEEFSFGALERLYKMSPDIARLMAIVWKMDGDTMIIAYPDLHRKLIGKDDESVEVMIENNLGSAITAGGIHAKLREALSIAFIPYDERENYIGAELTNQTRIERHFATNLPDLSNLNTPGERLDAVIDLLTYDINEALREVLHEMGISPDEFELIHQQNPEDFTRIHRHAGLLWSKKNLIGIIMDIENGGENNLFKNRPDKGDDAQTTDTGRCTGESYARNFLIGLGRALRKNRDAVLNAITQSEVLYISNI